MKIDVASIEGYAEMSAEDKVAALEAFEYDDNAEKLKNQKDALDKATREASDYKKQLREAQAKATNAQSEDSTKIEELQKQIEQMQMEKNISDFTAEYVAQGYSKELAIDSAKALAEGDMAKIFANQAKFLEEHDKAYKAKLMSESIAPDKGGKPQPTGMTKEKFGKMSMAERMKFANEHPDEYQKFYGGK